MEVELLGQSHYNSDVLVTQSCPTLHNPMDTRLLCSWDSPGKNTRVGCHSLLQGIFPTQGSNQVSRIAGRFFTVWASREAQVKWLGFWQTFLYWPQEELFTRPPGNACCHLINMVPNFWIFTNLIRIQCRFFLSLFFTVVLICIPLPLHT